MSTTIIKTRPTKLKFNPNHPDRQKRLDEVVSTVLAAKSDWPIGPRTIGYEMDSAYGSFKKSHWDGIKNHKDRVEEIITYARIHGLIPWRAIDDASGRDFDEAPDYMAPEDFIIDDCYHLLKHFRYNVLWNQPKYYEVWIEKSDLLTAAARASRPFGVSAQACGGNQSHKWLKQAAERFEAEERECVILLFTDLNTGGLRIAQQIADQLPEHYGIHHVTVDRRGMLPEHIQPHFSPKPLAGTVADQTKFIERFGIAESYEINSLLLVGIRALIKDTLNKTIDLDLLAEAKQGEEEMAEHLECLGDWATGAIKAEARKRGFFKD